jgi:competence protein ComEC
MLAGSPTLAIERRLEAERDRLALWLPVMLGAGVATWFVLPRAAWWSAAALAMLATGLAALAMARGSRRARSSCVSSRSPPAIWCD